MQNTKVNKKNCLSIVFSMNRQQKHIQKVASKPDKPYVNRYAEVRYQFVRAKANRAC